MNGVSYVTPYRKKISKNIIKNIFMKVLIDINTMQKLVTKYIRQIISRKVTKIKPQFQNRMKKRHIYYVYIRVIYISVCTL